LYIMENYLLRYAYHHQPGHGSWGSSQDQSVHGLTCVDSSSTTSGPLARDQESTMTWPVSCKRRESPFESLYNASARKRNIISEVDDKSIITLFKKGFGDPSLILKLTMKNPMTSEEMLPITNKYALVEEVTLDNREPKKDKELGHLDQPNTSKSNNRKRKSDHSVANIERSRHNKEYWPPLGEFEWFLDKINIFHP
jgi:hypothetical protein